jgi:hypothetical protein
VSKPSFSKDDPKTKYILEFRVVSHKRGKGAAINKYERFVTQIVDFLPNRGVAILTSYSLSEYFSKLTITPNGGDDSVDRYVRGLNRDQIKGIVKANGGKYRRFNSMAGPVIMIEIGKNPHVIKKKG